MSTENNQVGMVVGAGAGVYKGTTIILASIANLSFELLVQASVLAFAGGILGWIGSELMNQLKRLYLRWKNDKKNR